MVCIDHCKGNTLQVGYHSPSAAVVWGASSIKRSKVLFYKSVLMGQRVALGDFQDNPIESVHFRVYPHIENGQLAAGYLFHSRIARRLRLAHTR